MRSICVPTRSRSRDNCSGLGSQTALTAAGVAFVADVDRQAFKDLMRPIYSRYVTSPPMHKLVEQIDSTR